VALTDEEHDDIIYSLID